ncbi:tyrosine-type recombinase/integrase [Actinomadura sp. LOL_016]|uniref:tyrosine-type recombinase/integrase n=1 Tax=unclassified Actinomadura TaxID=2626254 RepID=UPI003A7F8E7B
MPTSSRAATPGRARTRATSSPPDGANLSARIHGLLAHGDADHSTQRGQPEPNPHARLHNIRHVHATTLLLAGVPVHVVAARLGHADPAITLRVYAHVVDEQLAEAATIFADRVDVAA